MELTRRDVLAALAATGAAVGTGAVLLSEPEDGNPVGEHEVATLVAVAEVVYPSSVDRVEPFVSNYSVNRVRDRPEYARGVAEAVGALDEYTTEWYDDEFAALDAERERALSGMDVDHAAPDPEGVARERVRYYLVNELLYALYTTPTGGELAGIENPQGHPGGTSSYQRGPD